MFAGAFVALFFAAVVVTVCGVLTRLGEPRLGADRALRRCADHRRRHTDHSGSRAERAGRSLLPEKARIPAGLVPRVASVQGVATAIPDRSVRTRVFGPKGAVPGPAGHDTFVHGWDSAALTPFELRAGHTPVGPDDVVIDAGLANRGHLKLGASVRLASTPDARPLTVVGIAATHSALRRQATVFVTDQEITRLAGNAERVDAVGVLLTPGSNPDTVAAAVRRAVGPDVSVLTGNGRGAAEFIEVADAREAMLTVTGLFAVLGLIIAIFVIAGTLGLAIQQREREIALLRAIAATPRQIRRMLIWEAVIVALVAACAGYLPGVALGHVLGNAFVDRGLAPEGMQIGGGSITPIVTVTVVVAAALLSVRAAARRAGRIAPTQALQESAGRGRLIGPVRLLFGLAALASGIALVFVASSLQDSQSASGAALGAALVLVVAAATLGPVVARLAAWVPGSLVARLSPVGGFLAVQGTRMAPRRLASAMTPLVLTVAIAGTLLFTQSTTNHAAKTQGHDRQTADLVLHGDGLGVPEATGNRPGRHPASLRSSASAPPTSWRSTISGRRWSLSLRR